MLRDWETRLIWFLLPRGGEMAAKQAGSLRFSWPPMIPVRGLDCTVQTLRDWLLGGGAEATIPDRSLRLPHL